MSSDHQIFDKLLRAWSAAIVANDDAAIGSFAEPDWVLVGQDGIFSREQFLDSVAAGRITHDTMIHEIHDVRVSGDVAVVLARGANTGTLNGQAFALDEWITEVFIRRDGRWRCSVTHLTSAKPTSA
jgi:ketosteroid isomerase-like protein